LQREEDAMDDAALLEIAATTRAGQGMKDRCDGIMEWSKLRSMR
jgi:hypothetical protein